MSSLQEHNPYELSTVGADYGNDVPSKPGDLVRHLHHRSFGVVVAIDPWSEDADFNAERRRALVLWAVSPPDVRAQITAKWAQQIQQEIDAEIMNDLWAQVREQ